MQMVLQARERRTRRLLGTAASVLALAVFAGCGSASNAGGDGAGAKDGPSEYKTAVLAQADFKSSGYGRGALEGIAKIKKEFGEPVRSQDNVEPSQMATVLRQYGDRGYDLVFAFGNDWATALKLVGAKYPKTQFVLVNGTEAAAPNVACVTFDWEQAGVLGGVAAGLATKTDAIGFVGGMKIPPIEGFAKGYEEGAKRVNPGVVAKSTIINSWSDTTKAASATNALLSDGSDVIFAVADTANIGVLQQVKKAGKLALYDGNYDPKLYPSTVLTSVEVEYGQAMLKAAELAHAGKLDPKVYTYGFAEHVFRLPVVRNVSPGLKAKIQKTAEDAASGGS